VCVQPINRRSIHPISTAPSSENKRWCVKTHPTRLLSQRSFK
jgi:hypothetical protein